MEWLKGVLAFVAAASVLIASIGATMAVADDSESPQSALTTPENVAPSAESIIEAHEAALREERERAEELAEPRFAEEREHSLHAYENLSPTEAEGLFASRFGEVLQELNSDPARFLSDARLDRSLGEGSAVVTDDGRTSLMEGPIPVEAESDEGDLEKVDLGLERTAEGYEPENPIIETTIAYSADDGVELGSEGLEVAQAGADESPARPFGDKNVFFGEVDEGTDTDLIVSPTATGVEFFDMLRSVDSPETLRFHVSLPDGASLQEVEGGAAEVRGADGSILAVIPKPSGVDAQGAYIPVSLEVEGDAVVLRVEHRSEDLAYPILVDPSVVYEDWAHPSWYENQRLGAISYWQWASNYSQILHPVDDEQWPGHHGLFIATPAGNLPAGMYGENYLFRNMGTYIQNATINYFWRANQSCSAPNPYYEPYDFDGLYDVAQARWNEIHFADANKYGNSRIENWGHELVVGMATSYATYIPCWRDLMAGAMEVWWGDWDGPELTYVSTIPSGWIKMDNTQRSISVSASDGGLGVQKIRLFGVGGREYVWNQPGCSGTMEDACTSSRSGTITYETSGSSAYEGEQTFTVQAMDPMGNGNHSKQYPVKLDGLAPSVTLNGQFATATEEVGSKEQPQGAVDKLNLPVYNLKIKAEDGSETSPRSGVKNVKIYMDGKLLETKSNSCSSSCPRNLEWTYPVSLTGLTEGTHTLEIGTSDFVGNEIKPQERKVEFAYIPATGMKEEYVLQHFVLPDGHDYAEEPEYRGPELAVNVTNGNLVYRERDLQLQAPSGVLDLERIYNSQQPSAKDTQWGHGWSLAQTPELKPEAKPTPQTATMTKGGEVTTPVNLPETQNQEVFNAKLHATIDKTAAGGYEVDYETEPGTSVFSANGRIEETRLGGYGGRFERRIRDERADLFSFLWLFGKWWRAVQTSGWHRGHLGWQPLGRRRGKQAHRAAWPDR